MKAVLKSLLKFKHMLREVKFDKIKTVFKDFSNDDFAHFLWDELLTDDAFDVLSFKLFYQLIEKKRHLEINNALSYKAEHTEHLTAHPGAPKNIERLLSAPKDEVVPEIYHQSLSAVLKNISFEGNLSFDRDQVANNYLLLLLDFLDSETEKERLQQIVMYIIKEWEGIIQRKDIDYIRSLLDAAMRRKKEGLLQAETFGELEKRIFGFIEKLIWDEPDPELEYFVDALDEAWMDADTCLTKIFEEQKVSPVGLKLFFKFFPTHMGAFYKNLEDNHSDMDFLVSIIGALEKLNSYLALEILKRIYSFSNELIQVEIIKAMQKLSERDDRFLLSVLQEDSAPVKKEALLALAKNEETKILALNALLNIPSAWGMKNKTIMQNKP